MALAEMRLKTQARTMVSLVAGLTLLFPIAAEAYIDPGAGSMVLQALIAGFFGLYFALKMYWNRGKHAVGSVLWKRKGSEHKPGDAV